LICIKAAGASGWQDGVMKHDALSLALRDARVPRYTSYPPANRFTDKVGAPQAASWIARADVSAPLSLYLHVPFCRRLCWFCACRTQGTRTDAPIDRYLAHLRDEIALVADLLPPGARIGRLHLGGGTPTILSPDRIAALASWLRAAFTFAPDAEVSVEIDPCDCDAERLDALVALGLTRVSIGVQDFDVKVQEAIGRRQDVAATRAVVQDARERGVDSVNFDLVYGLPWQDAQSLSATLDTVLDLRPDRLALFGYAHVPWMARRQRVIPEAALPGPEARLALAALARERLLAAGYVAVGIDHFARPEDALAQAAAAGTLRRNFQGYTADDAETLIGLGPSAISSFRQGIAQNASATGDWQDRIAEGGLATARGHVLSPMDRLAGTIIERLMCDGAVDLAAVAAGQGADPGELARRAERALADLPGVGALEGAVLRANGTAGVRLLAACFDPGYEPGATQYSQAS
jgi:oxygen-independent coproporphyrinogen III oxidase